MDNYGNERDSQGLFQEHIAGGDSVTQAAAGVNFDDDMFTAAEKVREYNKANTLSDWQGANKVVATGTGKSGGIFSLIPIIAAIVVLGYIFNVVLPNIWGASGRIYYAFTALSIVLVPAALAWAFIFKRKFISRVSVRNVIIITVVWFVGRTFLLGIEFIADIFVALLILLIVKRSMRVGS